MSNQPIVIDTPEGIAHWNMCRTIAALSIEVNTGMTMSRGVSVLKIAKKHYNLKAGTKAKALVELKEKYRETYGREYGSK